MSIKFTMKDINGNIINKGDRVLVGVGGEFDRFIFRCIDVDTNLAFIKPLKKNAMSQQALPHLIQKEEL